MTVITFVAVLLIGGYVVVILKRRRDGPLHVDDYGSFIPGIGRGVTMFGAHTRGDAEAAAESLIENVTEVR